jgi:hypothetical protein
MDNLYVLERPDFDPDAASFAGFSHLGTWEGRACDVCNRAFFRLVLPLLIEWDIGSDRIGDFSWCGYTCLVTEHARNIIESIGCDADFRAVTICPPSGKIRKNSKRVPYPYGGPELYWFVPRCRVVVDPDECGLQALPPCSACGRGLSWKFKRNGLIISRSMQTRGPFHIEQFHSDAIFASEQWVTEIRGAGLTNLGISLAGSFKSENQ